MKLLNFNVLEFNNLDHLYTAIGRVLCPLFQKAQNDGQTSFMMPNSVCEKQ